MISRMKRSHLSRHVGLTDGQVIAERHGKVTWGIRHGEASSWLAPSKTSSALCSPKRGLRSVYIPSDEERIGVRNLLLGKQSVACDIQSSRDLRQFKDRELGSKHEVSR